MTSATAIRGISRFVVPLTGWRRPEHCYVMVLVCYLDDAGTDPQNQFVSLSGFIGTLDAWRDFEMEAKAVMDKYGVSYIRGRDIFANDGDYKGWLVDKKVEFVRDINSVLAPRVGLALSFGTLKSKFNERAQGRRRVQSPFGFSFEMLFHALLNDEGFMRVVEVPEVNLSFVIEDGNENNAEIFQRYQRLKRDHGHKLPFFAGMSFAKKDSSIAIQVADLLAFLARRHTEDMERNNREQVPEHHYLTALRKNIRCLGRVSKSGLTKGPTKLPFFSMTSRCSSCRAG